MLTDKQSLFVREYLVDLNATQAAIRAGYSEKTAKEIGCENLSKPNIQKAIQEAMNKRSERVGLTADEVLEGIKDIYTQEKQEDPKTALKALELAGKHLKLFTDKVEHSGSVDVNVNTALIDKYLSD